MKRRLYEEYLKKKLLKANPQLTDDKMISIIKQWVNSSDTWSNDKLMVEWLEAQDSNTDQRVNAVKDEYITSQVSNIIHNNANAAMDGVLLALQQLPADQRSAFVKKLTALQ